MPAARRSGAGQTAGSVRSRTEEVGSHYSRSLRGVFGPQLIDRTNRAEMVKSLSRGELARALILGRSPCRTGRAQDFAMALPA